MSLDLEAIHRALADQIRDYIADDWNVQPFAGSGAPLPLIEVQPGTPYVDYFPPEATFCEATINLRIWVFLPVPDGASNPETVFQRMARALSSGDGHGTSIADAVMAGDKTLGGLAIDMQVFPAEYSTGTPAEAAQAFIPVSVTVER